MGVQIEELRAYFTANYAGFLKGTKAVQDATQRLANSADAGANRIASAFKNAQKVVQAVGPELQKVGAAASSAMNRITVAAAGVVTKTATSFGQFELTMKRAGAVTNTLGTETFKQLENAAIEMGRTTVYSAAEAAAAVEKLGLAGLSAEEIMKALPGALQLASAAQVDIATAADVAAKTMRAFGADADSLTHINDVLVKTFTTANTDMGQLAEAMKHAAPVSKGLGVSIEDTAAAIAKMSDAGFQGSIAGTALRNIMSRLAGATPEAIGKLEALGVTTLDSSGKMRPFLDILEDIEKSGMSSADMLSIFGQRGGPQLMALMEVGTAELRRYSQELQDAGGIAQRVSDESIDTLWGSFKMFESELETVTNDLGQQLKPAVEQTFKLIIDNKPVLIELANQFAQWVQWIVKLAVENPKLTAALVALRVTGLLGVNKLVLTLAGSLGNMATSLVTTVAQMGAAKAASVALQGSLATLAAAGILIGAKALYDASRDIQAFNEALQKSAELSGALAKQKGKGTSNLIDRANTAGGAEGKAMLQAAIDQEQKEIEAQNTRIAGQRKRVEELAPTIWTGYQGGRAVWIEEQKNLQDLEDKLKGSRERVEQLQDAMESLGEAAGDAAKDAAAVPNGVEAAAKSLVGNGSGVDKTIAEAQQAAIEAKSPGYGDVRELIQAGANGQDLQQFVSATGSGSVLENNAAWDAGRELEAINANGGFKSQEEIDAFAKKIADAANAAAEAEQKRLDLLAEEEARIAEIPNVLKSMEGMSADIKSQLAGLDAETAGPLAGALQNIQERFASGKMSADDFTASMQGLKSATDQATAAAKREQEEKDRQAILRGDFSSLDPQKALEDKLYQLRMNQFNQGVDQMFSQMMGIGQAVQPVVSGFSQLSDQMQNFGDQLNESMQPGGSGGNAAGAIFSWLNSVDGIASSLYNNISMLEQSLQYIQDPRRRQEVLDQISGMQNQLNNLNTSPYVYEDQYEGIKDPAASGGGNSAINVNLPNISRVTNSDVRMLTDAISRELERRGRRV